MHVPQFIYLHGNKPVSNYLSCWSCLQKLEPAKGVDRWSSSLIMVSLETFGTCLTATYTTTFNVLKFAALYLIYCQFCLACLKVAFSDPYYS